MQLLRDQNTLFCIEKNRSIEIIFLVQISRIISGAANEKSSDVLVCKPKILEHCFPRMLNHNQLLSKSLSLLLLFFCQFN